MAPARARPALRRGHHPGRPPRGVRRRRVRGRGSAPGLARRRGGRDAKPRPDALTASAAPARDPGPVRLPVAVPSPPPPEADPLLGTDGRLTVLLLGPTIDRPTRAIAPTRSWSSRSIRRPASRPGSRSRATRPGSRSATARSTAPRSTACTRTSSRRPATVAWRCARRSPRRSTSRSTATSSSDSRASRSLSQRSAASTSASTRRTTTRTTGSTPASRAGVCPPARATSGPNDALIFARSRKGDNDFGRARRQQILVLAALDKARSRGIAGLPKLLRIAARTVRTDLPLNRANDLFDIVEKTECRDRQANGLRANEVRGRQEGRLVRPEDRRVPGHGSPPTSRRSGRWASGRSTASRPPVRQPRAPRRRWTPWRRGNRARTDQERTRLTGTSGSGSSLRDPASS